MPSFDDDIPSEWNIAPFPVIFLTALKWVVSILLILIGFSVVGAVLAFIGSIIWLQLR